MTTTPILSREEYVEQAYAFRSIRQRLQDAWTTQKIMEQLQEELLSTTRLPLAVHFMLAELKHSGRISDAMAQLPHYFTGFQSFTISRAEDDDAKLTFPQALLILEREAEFKSGACTPQGLFVYQMESLTRNQIGYLDGLMAMESDGNYDDEWRTFIASVRVQLGILDLAELIYLRSELFVTERTRIEPDYVPPRLPLFAEKEGRIAKANCGRDPNYLFSALQRQLGFPEVPRPPRASEQARDIEELKRKIKQMESKLRIIEGEVYGKTDPNLFVSRDNS